jgi:hypothetical protein
MSIKPSPSSLLRANSIPVPHTNNANSVQGQTWISITARQGSSVHTIVCAELIICLFEVAVRGEDGHHSSQFLIIAGLEDR